MMELWPFTNFHDLNQDWIIKTMKDWVTKMTGVLGEWSDMKQDWEEFTENTYKEQIEDILEQHPEWTTTVMDGAITEPKINAAFLKEIKNAYVTPEMYGAAGDGITDDTTAIQQAIDTGKHVLLKENAVYKVSKGNNSALYPDGDEPCLYIHNHDGQAIFGNNATLKVNNHGQGILEIVSSSNISVYDLHLEGYGSFPSISPSGRAEKGTSTEGYYNTSCMWETYKNNSYDSSALTGIDGAPAVWGPFGNGYICNTGSGLLIENGCENIIISNCSSKGFNYSGFQVGRQAVVNQTKSYKIRFENCETSNIYDSGFNVLQCEDVIISGCCAEEIGHPDARPVNTNTPYAYTIPDPGYGVCCRLPFIDNDKTRNIIIENSRFAKCVRKGVDSHGVDDITIKDCDIYLCYYAGIDMAGQDETRTENTNVVIKNNNISFCGLLGYGINLWLTTGSNSYDPNGHASNFTVDGNMLNYCATNGAGIFNIRCGVNTTATNNTVNNVWPLADMSGRSIINIGNGDKQTEMVNVDNNSIYINNTSNLGYPIRIENLASGSVSHNIAKVLECPTVMANLGTIKNEFTVIGNDLISGTAQVMPALAANFTGTYIGNVATLDNRGQKYIKDSFVVTGGYFEINDTFITPKSLVILTPEYTTAAHLTYIYATQLSNGHANVYVRTPDGTSVSGETIKMQILIVNYKE